MFDEILRLESDYEALIDTLQCMLHTTMRLREGAEEWQVMANFEIQLEKIHTQAVALWQDNPEFQKVVKQAREDFDHFESLHDGQSL